MLQSDPDNELAHFSLGKALLDTGRFQDAAASFARVIEINPDLSRAYHHLAEAQLASGHKDKALTTLEAGYAKSMARGDMMPAKSMAGLLKKLGHSVPDTLQTDVEVLAAGDGSFRCVRCGAGEVMAYPPMRGDLGEQVKEKLCGACWRQWLGMGTKIINEMRLDMREDRSQDIYDRYLNEYMSQ